MKLSSFNYLVHEGFSGIWKNKMMSFASFCITLVSLLMVGLSLLATVNITRVINSIEDKNEVVIVVKDGISDEDIASLGENLESTYNISSVTFFSKDEAWQGMKSNMSDEQQDLFQYADSNPLPNTYKVQVADISKLKATVTQVQNYANVESVKSPNEFADILVNLRTIVTIISTALVSALVVVCLVIISNTTRASVFSRRKEINIMKYVGANNSFIRIPFFVEGMSIGVISAAGALAITKYTYDSIYNILTQNITLQTVFGMSSIIPINDIILKVGLSYLVAGALIGAFGSVISTRKHLKV